ncbi:MAG: hypothetical protein V2A69_01345 [Pseudomonadota bacterium]
MRNDPGDRSSQLLSHEVWVPMAEITRQVGVCTSAISRAIRTTESEG